MMKNICELTKRQTEEFEIFLMPKVRIIGIAKKCTFEDDANGISPHEEYWDKLFSFRSGLMKLPHIIENSMICWTGDSPAGSNYYTYMPGVICPESTSVPDGLDFRDLPSSYVAKGTYGNQENLSDVISYFKKEGFKTCYTDLGWNAKLFLGDEEIQKHFNSPCRWLVPCIK